MRILAHIESVRSSSLSRTAVGLAEDPFGEGVEHLALPLTDMT